ncbi:MAG: hypothetical protein ABI613_08835 [Gemmatimonadota bacterium]
MAADRTRASPASPTCIESAGPGQPASNRSMGLPDRTPDMLGTIVQVSPGLPSGSVVIRVEPDSTKGDGISSAVITVSDTVPVMQRSGHRATSRELRICQLVGVWFGGPVRETFPVQVTSQAIVIERIRDPGTVE